jgi:hypothetical protein
MPWSLSIEPCRRRSHADSPRRSGSRIASILGLNVEIQTGPVYIPNRDNTRIAYIPSCPSVQTLPNRSATRHSGQCASLTPARSRRVILRRNRDLDPPHAHPGLERLVDRRLREAHASRGCGCLWSWGCLDIGE